MVVMKDVTVALSIFKPISYLNKRITEILLTSKTSGWLLNSVGN